MRILCESLAVSSEEAQLLRPLSCELQGSGLIALTGPNGAGKTTLLKILAGRMLPTAGRCEIRSGGEGFSGVPAEHDRGFRAAAASLIDTPPMAREMTLSEQLTMVGASWGAPPDSAEETSHGLLERLTIPQLAGRFPHELSAGQLQLFLLALTLARPAELLLLDEPERHLDGERIQVLLSLLEDRAAGGTTVITATHRREIIEQCGQRVDLGGLQG